MLDKHKLQQQDKLNLLNTTSLRIIPILAEHTDLDGMINISVNEIKKLGFMTPKLVPTALDRLVKVGWIRKTSDGKMFALYTCNTTHENKDFYYINTYKVFKEDAFKKMYKRAISFFYYLLAAKVPGRWHTIAVERLYKNKTFAGNLAIEYFEDFDDLMEKNFIPLIKAGFIEVKLGPNGTTLTSQTAHIKEQIYAYCGKENLSMRKKRMKDTHILHIRIAKEVIDRKSTIFDPDRRSTLRDLAKIAYEYGYSIDLFPQEALEEVHMTKHKIFKEFGQLGIKIYRESLCAFFENSEHSFAPLMDKKQFGRAIKNHYVIPRITMELTAAIQSSEKNNLSKTEAFLQYMTTEAYADELVLFDKYMNESHAEFYKDAVKTSPIWKDFSNKVNHIFTEEKAAGNGKDKVVKLAQQKVLSSNNRPEEKEQVYTYKERTKDKAPDDKVNRHEAYRNRMKAKGLLGQGILPEDYDF
ncbi:hypothetical protein [Heyndrickxia acidicola]|uniref:Uncharacterized protein n=1 Tax=Heyndrickxia acidicola TaxID=209389 RepID=A0ABU6ME58_9BACI|nr:hypothetical protein [Heyndrickxia acidicola]MED1202589.1 hypothetical protein [Heyndrickxia acidicola]